MEIKQLTYFLRIAREESYSLAARELSVSQPALSMAIKNLEDELGVKLFHSSGRKQQLTNEGKVLYEKACTLLDVYQETLDILQSEELSKSGSITIGLPPIIGTCYFTDIVDTFASDHPNIQVSIVEDGSGDLQDKVMDGSIDIALTILPLYSTSFNIKHIIKEKNVVLVHPSHPLSKKSVVSIADLKDDHLAIFNSEFVLHHQIVDACKAAGFMPKISVLSSQWDFLVEIVSQNRAVSILPKPIMDKFPHENVCCLPIKGDLSDWRIVLIYSKNHYLSKACEKFLTYVENKFAENDDIPQS